jgi:hypothetical protein
MGNDDDEKAIILERLQRMPPTLKLSFGDYGSFTKDQLIDAIERDTDVGKMFVSIHMKYVRSHQGVLNGQ